MNIIGKVFLNSVIALSLLLLPIGLVMANETSVVNSGDDVEIETETELEIDTTVINENKAKIFQAVTSISNTGDNESEENISLNGGSSAINTGNALSDASLEAFANKNTTVISTYLPSIYSGNTTDVINTGDDVEIETETELDIDTKVINENEAWILQKAFVEANTGYNESEENIGGGSINTGNADADAYLKTKVNSNWTAIATDGSILPENNDSEIINTGDDLDFEAEASAEIDTFVKNENELWSWQFVKSISSTGDNESEENIGGALIDTGNSTSEDSAVLVDANSNNTVIGGFDSLLLFLISLL